jgi:hypothetical protein
LKARAAISVRRLRKAENGRYCFIFPVELLPEALLGAMPFSRCCISVPDAPPGALAPASLLAAPWFALGGVFASFCAKTLALVIRTRAPVIVRRGFMAVSDVGLFGHLSASFVPRSHSTR